MNENSSVLLDTTTHLPDGPRLRVRMPHASDFAGLRALNERLGLFAEHLDLARALRFDPRHRAVACATAWVGGAELLVGYGAIERTANAPDLLVADETIAPGVRDVLVAALRDHAAGRTAA